MAIKTKSASSSKKSTYKKSKSNYHAGRLLIIAICAVFVLLGVFLIVNSFAGTIAGSSYYKAPTPLRIFDSRTTAGGGEVTTNKVVDSILPFGAGNTPPTNVKAVVVNATVVDPRGATDLKIWQAGTPAPTAPQVTAYGNGDNVAPGGNLANEIIVPFDSNGSKYLQITNSKGSSQVVLDYIGYYSTTGNPSPLGSTNAGVIGKQLNYSTAPGGQTRVYDTRISGGSLSQGENRSVRVLPVPDSSVKAAIIVATVVAPTTPGYMDIYEGSAAKVTPKSSLSFPSGRNTSNELIVPVDANGNINVFNANGSAGLVIDLMGYYKSSSTAVTGRNFILPTSVFLQNNDFASGTDATVAIANKNGVPSPDKLAAAIINVTVSGSTVAGYNVLYPTLKPVPLSSMNFAASPAVTSEQMIVPTGADGTIRLTNFNGTNSVSFYLVGYITK